MARSLLGRKVASGGGILIGQGGNSGGASRNGDPAADRLLAEKCPLNTAKLNREPVGFPEQTKSFPFHSEKFSFETILSVTFRLSVLKSSIFADTAARV